MRGEDVARELQTSVESGLSTEEVDRRVQEHGPNVLPQAPRESLLQRIWRQLRSVLVLTLLGAAVITGLLGHYTDTAVIALVVIVNAVLGLVQEGKALRALEGIRALVPRTAMVRRGGNTRTVSAEALVPGDVVLLQPGDRVPADLRLITARELRIDEAILTGESEVATKSPAPVEADTPVAERGGMAYCGTFVAAGHATAVVTTTGDATEIGRITRLLSTVPELETPLTRDLDRFARLLTLCIAVLALLTFAVGWFAWQYSAGELFMAAVSLAISAIPEGLPAVLTIALAVGVQRMARHRAIVRRLPAVEALGSVTVICTDKTGTLTRNEMTVRSVAVPDHVLAVSGVGYQPAGTLSEAEREPPQAPAAAVALARAALLCNDAALLRQGEQWQPQGDPTEAALIVLAMKLGLDPEEERNNHPRTDAIPFESERRYMATLHHDHHGHAVAYVKGAPERVLAMCDRQGEDGAPLQAAWWRDQADALADGGARVLAIACREMAPGHRDLTCEDAEAGLRVLGLVGMIDAPREEARQAVADCRRAGIRVKMITGDHGRTALAIARELGIAKDDQCLSGTDIDRLSTAELQSAVTGCDVFARTTPEHKLRLVEALQASGEVVAMTGDGVNDAPALQQADVGIAMGSKGTDVARQSAEIVLADDNFATIARAVAQGRGAYENIRKSVLFILPNSFGEALTIVAAVALGQTLPITPAQILWINMVTTVCLDLALAMEPPEADIMNRPPRRPGTPLLSGYFVWRIGFVSLLMLAGALGTFLWLESAGEDLDTARTAAVNALVLFEVAYLINCRHVVRSALRPDHWPANPWIVRALLALLLLQGAFTYAAPFQDLFGTAPLPLAMWPTLAAMGAVFFLLVEAEKAIYRSWHRAHREQRA